MSSQPPPETPNYEYSTAEKLLLCFPSLRQRVRPARNLFAGPFAGEFGYELMQWQGFVRARRPHYEQVHVLTYPGRDFLYDGCTVHYHGIDLKGAGYGYGRLSPRQARAAARAKAAEIGLRDYDVFDPSLLCTQYHKRIFWRQDFKLLEEDPIAGKIHDVAFHFRAVDKEGWDKKKNYSPALAAELVRICTDRGLSTLCIGHPLYSTCPEGAADYRNVDLRKSIGAICSARLVAGEMSGPLHLANLCGKPTVFFADAPWRTNYSFRWNPFRVPLYVAADDTVQPEPALLYEALVNALADLRTRTNDFSKPAYQFPAQPIHNY